MSTIDRIHMSRSKPLKSSAHAKRGAPAADMTPRGRMAKGHVKGMLKARRRELAVIESRLASEGDTGSSGNC